MIKNYLKIAIRNLQRNRVYSLINIVGLTIGLAACLLVATVVIDDLSYDRQWKRSKDIFRIISVDNSNKNEESKMPESYSGLGPTLKKLFPEVTEYCRMSYVKDRIKLGSGRDGVELSAIYTEPSAWNVFDFTVISGNPEQLIKGYTNLVISEKIKQEYFLNTDPIGKMVYTVPSYGKPKGYIITGVIKNIPSNTHLRADVIEITAYAPGNDVLHKDGSGYFAPQYLLLRPGTSVTGFTKKINTWYKSFVIPGSLGLSYQLQPLKDVYLHSDFANYQPVQGSIRNVYIFAVVAIVLLLIACINFVNLTSARALKRLREAGIRKVLGAGRKQLMGQFLFESLIFFLISFIFGILFYNIFLGLLERFLEHPLALKLYSNTVPFIYTCGFVLMVSVLTGLYPSLLLSGRNPADTINGKLAANTGSGALRQSLVVLQFGISIVIIISAFVIRNQLQFMDKKDLGFDKNNLLALDFNNWEGKGKVFKQEMLRIPGVENASICGWSPSGGGGGTMSVPFDDPDQKKQ